MTTVLNNTMTVMDKMDVETAELHTLLGVVVQWMNENRTKVKECSPATGLPEQVQECLTKAEAIKLWTQGNLDMGRTVVSRAEALEIKKFAKNLRSLVRGTSQSYNSMAFNYKQFYRGSTVKRTFTTAATSASRLAHLVNTLESE